MPPEPMPGTGRMSLESFCNRYELDENTVIGLLGIKGITAQQGMTLKEIGMQHKLVPDVIYRLIKNSIKSEGYRQLGRAIHLKKA